MTPTHLLASAFNHLVPIMLILNLGEHIVEIAAGHSIIMINHAAYEQ
jgi:hypothetical protein